MIDTFNLYRNQSGRIELEKIPEIKVIEKPTYGSRQKIWFQIKKQQILFKKNMRINEDITEIINELISQFLGIECVSYDLATYQGMNGVITKQFLQPEDQYKPTICLLCGDHMHKISNDIYTILQALEQKQVDNVHIRTNIQKLMENQVQDVFTSQFDRNVHNTGFIQREHNHLLAPRHDSANSFLNIFDTNKMDHFLHAQNKEMLIKRYKGTRTKLKIMPNSNFQSSMEELVNFLYNTPEDIPEIMQQTIPTTKKSIEKINLLQIKELFYTLEQYNILISNRQSQFFEYIWNYNLEDYQKEKKKLLT